MFLKKSAEKNILIAR